MTTKISKLVWCFLFLISCILLPTSSSTVAAGQDDRKSYIVYMGERSKDQVSILSRHTSMLQEAIGSDFSPDCLLHSFKRTFNGFVAKLYEHQVEKIAGMAGVVSVFPNQKNKLHTTKSWDFMGFSEQVKRSNVESDVIIGVIDTGIWPESQSFNDKGFGPPPTKWKGSCQPSFNFSCNNKLLGAQYYRADGLFGINDIESPRDSEGHGTHTASTAVGGLVTGASLYGLASGTARGGVPSARFATYKVCWSDGCWDADILAAFDDAIADGVDIISISVGWNSARFYFDDSIAIGAFHAMRKGILTSASAGNDGPDYQTVRNFAPWFVSVAASTMDRKFITKVQLGNNKIYQGTSINTDNPKMFPVIYGGDAPNTKGKFNKSVSRFCTRNSLDPSLVKGKIVVCDQLIRGDVPYSAGATGILMQDNGPKDSAFLFPLPASYLDPLEARPILSYINSTQNATAMIYKSNEVKDTLAPYVVSFSSRGPNPVTPDILKPDITAPGVHILAAWTLLGSVSGTNGDNRLVPYNILSGTSMACPHVTAAAAYVKSYHPTWSPSAIKSSLMTTASPMNAKINPEAEFAYGAGHLDPLKAVDPGLVYDAKPIDYVKFLCGQGYNTSVLQIVTGDNSSCSKAINATVWDLNYPSFALSTSSSKHITRVFNRVVTNVGSPTSTYKAIISSPQGLKVQVNPTVLSFSSINQELSFALTVEGTIDSSIVSASLVWDDGVHKVRSPITVYIAMTKRK
ncbi:cucumisin-like isoform X1 [Euphorbia lathyris]|uniref:cucumisin-like isoform X1 n=1 Tax=Euphorbia lathyris TaxID=212925 RepID=UPI0033139E16